MSGVFLWDGQQHREIPVTTQNYAELLWVRVSGAPWNPQLALSVPTDRWVASNLSSELNGQLRLRLLRRSDAKQWEQIRQASANWLVRWEATNPPEAGGSAAALGFVEYVRLLRAEARQQRGLPFVIMWAGQLVGSMFVSDVQHGSIRSANLGYWIGQEYAGRSIIPLAAAMAVDYCFYRLKLHRIQVNIRPENQPSLRVVEKLGFRYEGTHKGLVHIAGAWRDHYSYALTAAETPTGLLRRFLGDTPS